jgi:hypothetical protein
MPRLLGLLRARRERPTGRRTSNDFDDIASPHWLPPKLRTTPTCETITARIGDRRNGVPSGRTALDNATFLPVCRKPPLTPALYSDAIEISGVPSPQCARPE